MASARCALYFPGCECEYMSRCIGSWSRGSMFDGMNAAICPNLVRVVVLFVRVMLRGVRCGNAG